LRILVGAEGGTQDFQVKPALQPEPGEYNEDLLDGLDFLLA
jgi:mannan endo-1,4-beta-mannosidase